MRRSLLVLLFALIAASCRGGTSRDPPLVVIRNMYTQTKYVHQGHSEFFDNGRQMRLPPEGTVAREMEMDPIIAKGRLEDDTDWTPTIPSEVIGRFGSSPAEAMPEMVHRGQDRFNIYCAPCHGRTGDGHGIVVAHGFNQPPTYHQDRIRHMPDGQMFATITNGLRNMPGYYAQIPTDDRWAIVAYVRALQLSQHAELADVPPDRRAELEKAP
jgi:mono/diheme cytochrome c family protein